VFAILLPKPCAAFVVDIANYFQNSVLAYCSRHCIPHVEISILSTLASGSREHKWVNRHDLLDVMLVTVI